MKTDKNKQIRKWVAKWASFRSRYLEKTGRVVIRKTRGVRRTNQGTRWKMFSTQSIRREMVRSLGDLYDSAVEITQSESLEVKEKEKWFRLCGYLAQTVNTLIKTYDDMKIGETLKGLEKYVQENIEAA